MKLIPASVMDTETNELGMTQTGFPLSPATITAYITLWRECESVTFQKLPDFLNVACFTSFRSFRSPSRWEFLDSEEIATQQYVILSSTAENVGFSLGFSTWAVTNQEISPDSEELKNLPNTKWYCALPPSKL